VAAGDFDDFSRQESAVLAGIAARLGEAKNPVLIGGADLLGAAGIELLLETAATLDRPERPCGAAILLSGPDSYGNALLAGDGPDFDELLAGIEDGRIKALVCVESDPLADHPQPSRVLGALSRLEWLLAIDYLPTGTVRRADLFLPSTAPAESAGTYINHEGRMLPFASVYDPGVPLRVTGGGDHPPRTFETGTPGNDPRWAWAILCELQGRPAALALERRELESCDPRFSGLAALDPEGRGRRVTASATTVPAVPPAGPGSTDGPLRLLATENLFGSGAIAAFSRHLDDVRPAPYAWLHVDDAARLGLAAGETVRVTTDAGAAAATLRLTSAMAPGLVVVARRRGTPQKVFF
jgi:NADH-quinone oxidoreductase subunit G